MSISLRVNDKLDAYILKEQLGKGTYGTIFRAEHQETKKNYAFKVALNEKHDRKGSDQLINEFKAYTGVLKALHNKKIDSSIMGTFPEVYWCQEIRNGNEMFTVLCMQLLTTDLEQLLRKSALKKISLNSVLMIALQLLQSLVQLHSVGILHCDVKPDNIMINKAQPESLFLLDLGISRKYWDDDNNKHIPYFEYKELHGTARYSSINAHMGIELTRRDDLESMAYVLLYLYAGQLPWQRIKSNKRSAYYEEILTQKMDLPNSSFLRHGNFDVFFIELIKYVRDLTFSGLPDYQWIKEKIYECANRNDIDCAPFSWQFDWNLLDPANGNKIKETRASSSKQVALNQRMRIPMNSKKY
jgi:casein kinase 1